ncbi:hypothetical protein J15TS10_01150 [Paenibacillus woosongensis]|uniref:Uncharacterized protein n=1 Tax=Paenibacillus woosongensis TaxID=307580 RepID=A0ABQ4MJY3_9BACL|nr:hypothetical protein J15TS10_01150 [Paenibacillus woosongensis]
MLSYIILWMVTYNPLIAGGEIVLANRFTNAPLLVTLKDFAFFSGLIISFVLYTFLYKKQTRICRQLSDLGGLKWENW